MKQENQEEKIKQLREQLKEIDKNWDFQKPFCDYDKERRECLSKLDELDRNFRFSTKSYQTEDIPKYGEVMSVEEFLSKVKTGWFIDYDGYGLYIEGDKMTDIVVFPSDYGYDKIRSDFDKIIWFNK
jgi:hypothetical protein